MDEINYYGRNTSKTSYKNGFYIIDFKNQLHIPYTFIFVNATKSLLGMKEPFKLNHNYLYTT